MKHTIVTVAHAGDFGMLHLQARSMSLYLRRDQIERILVIRNMVPAHETVKLYASMYDDFADLVTFIDGPHLVQIPECSGWFSQQILKLAVSKIVDTHSYLLLDAKNHFVFPLADDFLMSGNKVRSYWSNYIKHPLRQYMENSLRYFQIDPEPYITRFLPPVTPYMMRTDFVTRLMRRIEQKEGRPFPAAFLSRNLTEFSSLNAFIISCGYELEDIYDVSGTQCHTVWEAYSDSLGPDMADTENRQLPLFSVHRATLKMLNAKQRRSLVAFWKRRKLFRYIEEGLEYLRDPNQFHWR